MLRNHYAGPVAAHKNKKPVLELFFTSQRVSTKASVFCSGCNIYFSSTKRVSFQAVPIVDDLLSRNVLPIICGGTNYYIESLLWKILVEEGT
jgi:hypothetical protein